MHTAAVKPAASHSEIISFSRAGVLNLLLDLRGFEHQNFTSWLTANEKKKYSSFGDPRRRSFTAGRAALKLLIKLSTNNQAASMDTIETLDPADGLPADFTGADRKKFHTTLSHSEGFALACAHTGSIGADIQLIKPGITKLSAKFASPDELLRSGNDPESLTVMWSLKESYVKLSRISMSESFTAVKFLDRTADKIFFKTDTHEGYALYEIISGHIACVITRDMLTD